MPELNEKPAVKKVEITLTATTCVQYTEVVEVPADITDEELNKVVNKLYDTVGADEYSTVGDSWERGSCGALAATPGADATLSAVRVGGSVDLQAIDIASNPTD